MTLDAILARLAGDPHAAVDLAAFALQLSADEYPTLDVPAYFGRLDALAGEVGPRVAAADSLEDKVAELSMFLFDEEGFSGNADDYYDPRNSYLSDVLDRKLGIPITLSVLAAAVGGRCGLVVHGVGLPGHFVAKVTDGTGDAVLFDPYHGGRFLDPAGCEQVVAAVTGQQFAATPAALAPSPPGAVAQRVLNNLKGAYLRRPDFARAARVMARLLQLCPDDPAQHRDLGVALAHAGNPGKAVDHLEAYLASDPAATDAPVVRDFLRESWREVGRWN